MKKFLATLARFEYVAAFLAVLYATASNNLFQLCKNYATADFDGQNFLTWNFAAHLGLTPYKDMFYPYGVLFILRMQSPFWFLVYTLSIPVLFVIFLYIFNKLWNRRWFSYLIFIAFYFFVIKFTGFENFSRYGIVAAAAGLYAVMAMSKNGLQRRALAIAGFILGIVFSLIVDQGLYAGIILACLLVVEPLFRDGLKPLRTKEYYRLTIGRFIATGLGFAVGVLPFVIYLIQGGALADFVHFVVRANDIQVLSKIPFITYAYTIDNKITLTLLFLAIFYLAYRVIVKRDKPTLNLYLLFGWIVTLLLLEQKNFVRAINDQLTIFAFLLFAGLLFEYLERLRQEKIAEYNLFIYLMIMMVIFVGTIRFTPRYESRTQDPSLQSTARLSSFWSDLQQLKTTECVESNLKRIIGTEHPMRLILDRLTALDPSYTGKIMSFPADPLFYTILRQTPPAFFTTYEASPDYSQAKRIQFMEDSQAKYVIYNTYFHSLMDGSPNYMRSAEEWRYILNNYEPIEHMERYTIFERKADADIFKPAVAAKFEWFMAFITDIDFRAVPWTEGLYKKKAVDKLETVYETTDVGEMNDYLATHPTAGRNHVLVVKPEKTLGFGLIATLIADEIRTNVKSLKCPVGQYCVFNIGRLPLFYKPDRIMHKIEFNSNFTGQIILKKNATDSGLW